MFGTYFYNETFKRAVSIFGTLFNNITVKKVKYSQNKKYP